VDALSMPIGFAMPGGRFRKVIEKNTQIPAQRSFRLPPVKAGQPFELDIFQGDSDRIIDNEYLGTLRFPPEVSGQRVNFNLEVQAAIAEFGPVVAGIVVERGAGLRSDFCVLARIAPGKPASLSFPDDEDELEELSPDYIAWAPHALCRSLLGAAMRGERPDPL